jgi:hypothetical protein
MSRRTRANALLHKLWRDLSDMTAMGEMQTGRTSDFLIELPVENTSLASLEIQGTSMEPAIRCGARVWAIPVGDRFLSEGDVVTYLSADGSLVTHRIVECIQDNQAALYRVRGDCRSFEEIIKQTELVYKVLRISNFGFVYDTDSLFGHWVSKQASRRTLYWRMIQQLQKYSSR